jgi:hypothetical protein
MAEVAFTAYVGQVPTAGLTPTWHTAYNAVTEVEQVSGLPAFNDLGLGLYSFEPPSGFDFTGIIDLGATAEPRYVVYKANTVETFGAFDPAPVTGVVPVWDAYKRLDTGANVTPPAFTELGNGMYKFAKPIGTDPIGGLIDLGAPRDPQYLKYDAESGTSTDTSGPVITNVTPAAGSQLASTRTPVTFDVTDVDPGVQLVVVKLAYQGSSLDHVVWDGSIFRTAWAARSTVETITDGFRFSILPAAGWTRNISQIDVTAIDGAGNQS